MVKKDVRNIYHFSFKLGSISSMYEMHVMHGLRYYPWLATNYIYDGNHIKFDYPALVWKKEKKAMN